MNEPSIVSSSDIPAAKRTGSERIAYHGSPAPAAPPGEHEQGDLGGGVEAEAEQDPDRVHLPRLAHRAGEPAEVAVHQAAVVQLLLERLLVVGALLHLAEDPEDPDEDHDVQRGDRVEERAGDERPDPARDLVQVRAVALDRARRASGCRSRAGTSARRRPTSGRARTRSRR